MKGYTYKQLSKMDKTLIWHPFTQMKDWEKEEIIIIEKGTGNYIIDVNGKRYLDGVSSLWANVHGHRKKEIDRAIISQLKKISHSTFLGLSHSGAIILAKMLLDIVPDGLTRVFYSDSGATAVEIGIKIALQYWFNKGTSKRNIFISFNNAYHGDTIGSVSVGGIDLFHATYKPLLFKTLKAPSPYCYRCELGLEYPSCRLACADKIEELITKYRGRIAGLVVEPMVQAAGGFIMSPAGYLNKVRTITKKNGILLIADEVATGFGRTGKMFACEHEGIKPDIMAIAKGLTGGYLPVAATCTKEEIYNAFIGKYKEKKTFYHGHTYTANPLGVSAAIANLKLFKREQILKRIKPKIKQLKQGLRRIAILKHVGEIRQLGLMVGIELVRDKPGKQPYLYEEKIGARVCYETRKYGIFLRPLGDVIVLMPPLSITKKEISHLLSSIERSIKAVTEA